ncbi:mitochondrial carrier domain-containing protein [Peziza echinospora]|nr:mitochondrial carrier domain-containing protein [Peziza echinospora]
MSSTGLSTVVEFGDEESHIVAPPACSEHHLHHHHHRECGGDALRHGGGERAPIEAGSPRAGEEGGEIIITASQKMASAVVGSLITSLLVTPLDVVRVRLQAQHTGAVSPPTLTPASTTSSPTSLRPHKLPLAPLEFQSTLARLSPELGVTACCREVFWINNNAELCIAASSPNSSFSASPSPLSALPEACPIEQSSRRQFTGTWEGIVKIARYEGLTSLWRGLSPTLVMAVPANVIYFTGYESLRTSPLSPFSDLNSTWSPLLAGSSARMLAATAISPIELFRTRLWATSTPKSGMTAAETQQVGAFRRTIAGLVEMVKHEGWHSLWRGLPITLWRDVPFSGIYWLGYERTKAALVQHRERNTVSPPSSSPGHKPKPDSATLFTDAFVAGALSGSIAAFLTSPFDVGKTRIQVQQNPPKPPPPAGLGLTAGYAPPAPTTVHKSMPSLLFGIYKQEGIRGLWRGWVPRTLKVAPACAIMISTYEVGKQWADKINTRARERTD